MSRNRSPAATMRAHLDPSSDNQAQRELPFEAVPLQTRSDEPREAIGRLIRLKEVQHRVGLSRSTIYRFMAEGTFPKPVHLGQRSVGWIEHEIDDWLRSRSR